MDIVNCEILDILVEIVGYDKFLEICKNYGGNNLYIPTYNSAIRNTRNLDIIKRYNGINKRELAREYNISVNHLRKIIKDYKG